MFRIPPQVTDFAQTYWKSFFFINFKIEVSQKKKDWKKYLHFRKTWKGENMFFVA